MLRDKNLIPLSHQHQHALALCVRIERAAPIPDEHCALWQAEFVQQFTTEIAIHFTAEEQVLFPTAAQFPELTPLCRELNEEHAELREWFARAQAMQLSSDGLLTFARRLAAHVRKEERQLFESLQQRMGRAPLDTLGRQLGEALKTAAQTCTSPTQATRIRPARR